MQQSQFNTVVDQNPQRNLPELTARQIGNESINVTLPEFKVKKPKQNRRDNRSNSNLVGRK